MSDADIDWNDDATIRSGTVSSNVSPTACEAAKRSVSIKRYLGDREALSAADLDDAAPVLVHWCSRHNHSYVLSCVDCEIDARHKFATITVSSSTGEFGKDVAKEIRDLKDYFSKKPVHGGGTPMTPDVSVDRSVAEQVHADLDGLIKKHEGE